MNGISNSLVNATNIYSSTFVHTKSVSNQGNALSIQCDSQNPFLSTPLNTNCATYVFGSTFDSTRHSATVIADGQVEFYQSTFTNLYGEVDVTTYGQINLMNCVVYGIYSYLLLWKNNQKKKKKNQKIKN